MIRQSPRYLGEVRRPPYAEEPWYYDAWPGDTVSTWFSTWQLQGTGEWRVL